MKKFTALILAFTMVLSLCPIAVAAETDWEEIYEEAAELYYSGSYANGTRAYELVKDAASSDYAPALRLLGQCYQDGHGLGVKPENQGSDLDPTSWSIAAITLYERAAEQGDALALYMMACAYTGYCKEYSYDYPSGLEEQPEKSEEYFRNFLSAAENMSDNSDPAYPSILDKIGECYLDGKGVEQNYEKAFSWFKRAAELGSTHAMINLADLYHYHSIYIPDIEIPDIESTNYDNESTGYDKSLTKYIELLEKVGEAGSIGAMQDLYELSLDLGDELRVKWKSKIEAEYAKAAKLGDLNAAYWLGWDFDYGYWFEEYDYPQAVKWYTLAAELGCKDAVDAIGEMRDSGNATSKDYDKAKKLYEKAVSLSEAD